VLSQLQSLHIRIRICILRSHHVFDALWNWISLPSAGLVIQHAMQRCVHHQSPLCVVACSERAWSVLALDALLAIVVKINSAHTVTDGSPPSSREPGERHP